MKQEEENQFLSPKNKQLGISPMSELCFKSSLVNVRLWWSMSFSALAPSSFTKLLLKSISSHQTNQKNELNPKLYVGDTRNVSICSQCPSKCFGCDVSQSVSRKINVLQTSVLLCVLHQQPRRLIPQCLLPQFVVTSGFVMLHIWTVRIR